MAIPFWPQRATRAPEVGAAPHWKVVSEEMFRPSRSAASSNPIRWNGVPVPWLARCFSTREAARLASQWSIWMHV